MNGLLFWGESNIKTFACNKGSASLFNFQAYYCFPVDVDAIQIQATWDWNNTGLTGAFQVYWDHRYTSYGGNIFKNVVQLVHNFSFQI